MSAIVISSIAVVAGVAAFIIKFDKDGPDMFKKK